MAAESYFEKSDLQPRPTLQWALQYFNKYPPKEKKAIDLGCGNGRDTYALIQEGWKVWAFDHSARAIEQLQPHANLKAGCSTFAAVDWQDVALINASYALPFCEARQFPEVWTNIEKSLGQAGIFSGHFFGENDGWKQLIRFSGEDIKHLFSDFEMLFIEENEFDRVTVSGQPKHWHVFEIVAKKIS
ncbi:MAG: SAM-dependent methyltransferase [Saprospiraceae bacterium]|nr:MAG: SAM-dependent methyltransferase [Saprospiraceae bacterium]